MIPNTNKVMISLGSNDGNQLYDDELLKLRQSITSNEVYWVLSANHRQSAKYIRSLATKYNDVVIDLDTLPLSDGVHPSAKAYEKLSHYIK
jgi:lysophospholipase L1-like esterase